MTPEEQLAAIKKELAGYGIKLDFDKHHSGRTSVAEQLEVACIVVAGVRDAEKALRIASGQKHGLADYLHNRTVTVSIYGPHDAAPKDCQTANGGTPGSCTSGAALGDKAGIDIAFFNDGWSQRKPPTLILSEQLMTHELSHAILGSTGGQVPYLRGTPSADAVYPFPGTAHNDYPGLEDWGRDAEWAAETFNLYLWTQLAPGRAGFNYLSNVSVRYRPC